LAESHARRAENAKIRLDEQSGGVSANAA
jgi:hypothetical protein